MFSNADLESQYTVVSLNLETLTQVACIATLLQCNMALKTLGPQVIGSSGPGSSVYSLPLFSCFVCIMFVCEDIELNWRL